MAGVDYDALAAKLGGKDYTPSPIDYDALAAKFGGRDATPSTMADVGKSAVYAIPKAFTGMAGLPGDVRDLSASARNKVLSRLPDSISPTAGAVANAADYLNPATAIAKLLPTSGQLRGAAESVTGPWYDPQTRAGKVTDTALQTASLMGRNLLTAPLKTAGIVAGSTAGTEIAGAQTADNPWMRFVGGLLGASPVALASAYSSAPAKAMRQAVGDITPAEIAAAQARQDAARASGVPLLGPEALPDSGIQQLASDVAASRAGGAVIRPVLAQRSAQVRSAVQGGLLGPIGAADTPAANAARAQTAATQVIENAESARTAAVNPFYKAAEGETLPPSALRPVANEIQGLLFRAPHNSVEERALGAWHKQLFPGTPESAAVPEVAAASARGPRGLSVDPATDDIVTAIRKLGGINPGDEAVGSLAKANPFPPDPRFGPVWRNPAYRGTGASGTAAGHSLDRMTELLHQYGYVPSRNSVDQVMDKIADTSMGFRQHHSMEYTPQVEDPLASAINQLTEQLAVKNAPKAGAAGEATAALPETNVGRLNTIYKNLGILGDTSAIGATAADKMAAYPAQRVRSALDTVLTQGSPNLQAGRQLYENITRNTIDPLRAGPVGVVAGRTGFDGAAPSSVPRVTGAISNADVARPETIRSLYTNLNGVDRQAFPGIARTWLENAFNDATQRIHGGENRMLGANFAKSVFGTDQQRANFNEVLRGVAQAHGADPDQFVRGANTLMQTLEATGRIPNAGSPTVTRGALTEQLGKSPAADFVNWGGLVTGKTLAARFNDALLAGRYGRLAQAFTAPDSVQQIARMAKLDPRGVTAQYVTAALLGLDRAAASE